MIYIMKIIRVYNDIIFSHFQSLVISFSHRSNVLVTLLWRVKSKTVQRVRPRHINQLTIVVFLRCVPNNFI